MFDTFIQENGFDLTRDAVKLNEDIPINYAAPFMPLWPISPVNSLTGSMAVRDGWKGNCWGHDEANRRALSASET